MYTDSKFYGYFSVVDLRGNSHYLFSGDSLKVTTKVKDVFLSAEFDLRGLVAAKLLANEVVNAHQAKIAQACKVVPIGGCVMTSAAVDILGRSDSCFELTQMRKLRAKFPEQTDIVDAYVTTSHQILTNFTGLRLKIALLLFYGLIVWPTAVLVRLGLYAQARATYLFGFKRLCRLTGILHSDPL